jgi:hypothetical protein
MSYKKRGAKKNNLLMNIKKVRISLFGTQMPPEKKVYLLRVQ